MTDNMEMIEGHHNGASPTYQGDTMNHMNVKRRKIKIEGHRKLNTLLHIAQYAATV